VVYPRIRKDDGKLHIQIMGIWDPQLVFGSVEGIDAESAAPADAELPALDNMGIPDNYFSVRGEVIFQSREKKEIFVKIRQAARKKHEESRHFKLRLIGDFPQKMVGDFWEFDVLRQGDDLVIRTGNPVASLRAKPSKGFSSKPPGSRRPMRKPEEDDSSDHKAERPVIKKVVDGESPKPTARPLPKKIADDRAAD
jgi:hypothetical protein